MKKETTNEPISEAEASPAALNEDGKVGGMLKEARMKKGLKIVDIAKDLCIRRAYLEAIESSNYDEIPEYPYGVGFIRSYAEFLGLNSARVVQLFKEETDASSRPEEVFVLEPQAEATVPGKKYILISLGAILLLYLAWLAYAEKMENDLVTAAAESNDYAVTETTENDNEFPLQVEDFATIDETVPPATDEVVVIDATASTPASSDQIVVNEGSFVEPVVEAPVVEPVPAEEAKPVDAVENQTPAAAPEVKAKPGSRILVKVNKETWVEVKDSNKLWISKVLQPGATYSVPAGAGKILSVGRADAVEVLVDGKVTPVVSANKKTGIALDKFLEANH